MFRSIALLPLALLTLAASSLAACGGTTTKTVTQTVTVQASAATSTDPASTTPTTSTDEQADTSSSDDDSCDARGINPQQRKEGTCTSSDGSRIKVVNRDTTLELPELNVRLLGVTTARSLSSDVGTQTANGIYVICKFRVTNKTDAPAEVDPTGVTLSISPGRNARSYEHDFDAENQPGDSFSWRGEKIGPDEQQTGTVIFDIPTKRFPEIARSGNIQFLQFSDQDGLSDPAKTIGVIRTYA